MRWDMVLERRTINRLNPNITRSKLRKIAESASRNKAFGFEGRIGRMGDPEVVLVDGQQLYVYRVKLRLQKENCRSDDAALRQFEHILKVVSSCANSEGWKILQNDQPEAKTEQESQGPMAGMGAVQQAPRPRFVVPELTDEVMEKYFYGIYEREEHIRNIHAAVKMAQDTQGEILPHVLLYGRPGACKTVLMERFKEWYDNSNSDRVERVKFVDCTTMTQAGIENWLLEQAESDTLPEVLVLDEIEKQDKKNLSAFLSIMGSGIIARLNSRIGNRRERAAFVVAGICNDEQQLKAWQDGALWSRFGGNKLFCPRPSKELCLKILSELVRKIPDGKQEWAEAALAFGWDELGERDIREIKDHLCGRDRLLTREWQEDKLTMLRAKQKEDAERESQMKGQTYREVNVELPCSRFSTEIQGEEPVLNKDSILRSTPR